LFLFFVYKHFKAVIYDFDYYMLKTAIKTNDLLLYK
jgi:hypothetical protein